MISPHRSRKPAAAFAGCTGEWGSPQQLLPRLHTHRDACRRRQPWGAHRDGLSVPPPTLRLPSCGRGASLAAELTCAPAGVRRLMAQRALRAPPAQKLPPENQRRPRRGPSPTLLTGQLLPAVPDPRLGGKISPSSRPARDGSTWRWSSICARAASSVGVWPITCVRIWSRTRSAKPSKLAPPPTPSSTAIAAANTAALPSAPPSPRLACARACPAALTAYDNAWPEVASSAPSNTKWLQGGLASLKTRAMPASNSSEYIDGCYNFPPQTRLLGYQTPNQFEAKIHSAN